MITLFRIATFCTVLISTLLAVYVFNNREKSPSLRFLSGLMIANVIYATSYFFEISAPVRSQLIFFLNLEYVGITFLPVFWILIAWTYDPDQTRITRALIRRLRLLYLIPVSMIIFIWTNEWHRLMYYTIDMEFALPITLLKVDRAPGFWVVNGIMMLLFLIGSARMVYNLVKAHSGSRKQYLLLTLASLPPFISFMLVLNQSVPYHLDLSPIAFAISGLMVFWGIMNMQLFNMVPIAEHMVVNAMHDAMIVLDTKGYLIESNTRARALLGKDKESIIGLSIQQLNAEIASCFTSGQASSDILISLPGSITSHIYTVDQTPITDSRNRIRGYLLLLHDVTQFRAHMITLEHLAASDGLTDLLNHRHFITLAQQEANRLQRLNFGEFSLIMFDIDHFKAINDTYGHSAGDMVLQRIARIMQSYSRERDLCARYGGEEFIILLMDTALAEAHIRAKELCSVISSTTFDVDRQITASFGVSTYRVASGISWEVALNQADTALYQAKAAGRNCVITAE